MAEHTFKKQRSLLVDAAFVLITITCELFMSICRIFIKDPPKDISGEIVLVTGAAQGLGRELALQYTALGCEVICVDVNDPENAKTVKDANFLRMGTAYAYHCDITSRQDVLQLAVRVAAEVGQVSVIVNNATLTPAATSFLRQTESQIRATFDRNVFSHFWLYEAFLPHLLAQGRGHIVSMSSMSGLVGMANMVPFCASKYAVRGLMAALDQEIRANNLATIETTTVYPFMVSKGLLAAGKGSIRFPSLLGVVSPKEAAANVIDAHRRNVKECTIPGYLFSLNNIFRCFPSRCVYILSDFIDSARLKTTSSPPRS